MQCCGKIDYFVFIIIWIFLFSLNLFADFFKFFKCRIFNEICRKSTENVCQWDIKETNNWIKLVILMIRVNFYFLILFLNSSLVYCLIFVTYYSWSSLNSFLKTILKIIPLKWTIFEDFIDWICALVEQICP